MTQRQQTSELQYEPFDHQRGPRGPPLALPLALAAAVATAGGLLALICARFELLPGWLASFEQLAVVGMALVIYVGQPLALAAMLVVRRPWSRERPPCRLTHPVPLIALACLIIPPAVALPVAIFADAPQVAGACGCGPILLVLALLLWFGGVPSRADLRREPD